jgi:predicted outer membrane repeat protein
VTITNSVISDNSLESTFVDDLPRISRLSGAGLRSYQGNTGIGDLVVSNTTFDSNTITSAVYLHYIYGGGIAEAMNMTLSYSTLSSNDSAGSAGALMPRGFFGASIFNWTFSGNHAAGKGGAIFGAGPIAIDNSTIAFNSSDADGGGVYFNNEALLRSSIIAKNTGVPHPDFMVSQSAIVTGNNDFIGDPAGLPVGLGDLTGDPMLGPLADNGGPTLTHALLSGSTAIDAGTDDLGFEYDQRGAGFHRVNGAAADIGAFETGNSISDEIFADGFDP